jgi:hypothetical protein
VVAGVVEAEPRLERGPAATEHLATERSTRLVHDPAVLTDTVLVDRPRQLCVLVTVVEVGQVRVGMHDLLMTVRMSVADGSVGVGVVVVAVVVHVFMVVLVGGVAVLVEMR